MELKEQIADELRKYIDKFDKYDKELPELVEKKEKNYQEKKKEFEEKWDEDIFPTDIPIKEKEQKQLSIMENNLKRLKKTLDDEIKENESNLKASVMSWKNKIDERKKELAEYVKNKDKYLEQKNRLEKELKTQIEGIKAWEKNGIDPNDVLYRKRKDEIIPNLESQISDINLKLDEKEAKKEYSELSKLNRKIKEIELHDRKHILPELAEIFEISKDEPEKIELEQQVPEQQAPEQQAPEQQAPEQQAPEQQAPEQQTQEQQVPEQQAPEQQTQEQQVPEQQAPEQQTQEQQVPEQQAPEQQAPEQQTQEQQVPEQQIQEQQVPEQQIPVQQAPAQQTPIQQAPVQQAQEQQVPTQQKTDHSTTVNTNKEALTQIIIGRKIKIKSIEDGKEIPVVKSKKFFEYMKSLPKNELATKLLNRLNINDNSEAVKLNIRQYKPNDCI